MTKIGYRQADDQKSVYFIPAYLCFIVFGILVALNKPAITMSTVLISILAAFLFAILVIFLLSLAFKLANPNLMTEGEGQVIKRAVSTGMSFMIPFTVLAVLADVVLGWDAVMPFASAAVMTAGASAGMEVMKAGVQGIKNVLLPTFLSFIISTSWMILVGFLP
ncbi:hypothetical protein SPSYN_00395 [Sporotomaculum syntrophicum]|uniref:Uncharacterized protein n=2 Tax=Sporotomaculum syntrophicum TaxID=182264 RepID=A0A9D2WTK3_9FIRM|nr:hypothetical protein SPSYN_00395 [Sporotomaculum syntrophicum]